MENSESNQENKKALDGYIVSYAQNREDLIIRAFFPDVTDGFYIDIGANDPQDDSVTKIFYDSGWSGINVEPNPDLIGKLEKYRKRDMNLNIGVSDKSGTMKLRAYSNHGLSTFSETVKKEYLNQNDEKVSEYKDYSVKVINLEDLFKKYADNRLVNFIKIDVEGYEKPVIDGNDWRKYRPELICIEENHIGENDWRKNIIDAGYTAVFNDGLNGYYLRNESMDRFKKFNYVNSLILDGVVINPGVAHKLIELEDTRSELDGAYKQLVEAKRALESTRMELFKYKDISFLVGKLVEELRGRIVQVLKKTKN